MGRRWTIAAAGTRAAPCRAALRRAALCCAALCCSAVAASGQDLKPLSTTAIGVTGPVRLDPTALRVGRSVFPLDAVARKLPTKDGAGEAVVADLYRVTKPADPVLNAPNRFCGSAKAEPVRWLFVWRDKDGIVTLSPSSAAAQPAGPDDTCGTYSYTAK